MKSFRLTAALAVVAGLSACEHTPQTNPSRAAAESAAVTPERIYALKTQVLALVRADENCVLPEFMGARRAAEFVDLGGGDLAVLVVCSTGTADLWSSVYVSQNGNAPKLAPLPLYKFQDADGWQSWEAMSNMAWSAEKGFAGSTRHQASGCAEGATWRWADGRLLLATQWHMDCAAIRLEGKLPDPIQDFPTTPPTEQPIMIAPEA